MTCTVMSNAGEECRRGMLWHPNERYSPPWLRRGISLFGLWIFPSRKDQATAIARFLLQLFTNRPTRGYI